MKSTPTHTVVCRTKHVDGLTVRELVHAPGLRKGWHSHELGVFVLTLDGSSTERFANAQYERSRLSVLFRPPKVRHCDFVGAQGAKCLLVEFSEAWISTFERSSTAIAEPSLHQLGVIPNLAQRAYREWLQNDNASPIAIEALALEMIAHLVRERETKPCDRSPFWLRKVIQRLDEGFTVTPTLTELAELADVHPTHLAREFRRHYSKSVGEYLRQRRVDAACQMLVRTDRPLVEIALATGFAHHAHFAVIFKRFVGLTPSEYRRLARPRKRRGFSLRPPAP